MSSPYAIIKFHRTVLIVKGQQEQRKAGLVKGSGF